MHELKDLNILLATEDTETTDKAKALHPKSS